MATEPFLVNEDPSRGPGLPECFVVSDSYRLGAIRSRRTGRAGEARDSGDPECLGGRERTPRGLLLRCTEALCSSARGGNRLDGIVRRCP
ncbi:hypothetical protein COCON_G00210660 [Conger conger]|uniref:Uncharacterized protein n=1 Tax=Conger conger TaxID=82655 RepID=A0A9Q1HQK3_CONCO|nr:hypothetical protein COCON_G00210660 [Conger conger]